MEVIFLVIEGLGVLLDGLNLIGAVIEAVLWFKGKTNRKERRDAKRAGLSPPKRNRWNKALIVVSALLVILIGMLLIRIFR